MDPWDWWLHESDEQVSRNLVVLDRQAAAARPKLLYALAAPLYERCSRRASRTFIHINLFRLYSIRTDNVGYYVSCMYLGTRQFQHAQQDNIYDIALP